MELMVLHDQLPRPYPDGSMIDLEQIAAYKIYVRVLGKPGGSGSDDYRTL